MAQKTTLQLYALSGKIKTIVAKTAAPIETGVPFRGEFLKAALRRPRYFTAFGRM